MRIIHWNIRYNSTKEKIVEAIKQLIDDKDTIICLQEVIPSVKQYIVQELFQYNSAAANRCVYSLDYRQPGKYDGQNRTLGILMICSESMYVVDAGVLNRCPLPDRTLFAEILYKGEIVKVLSVHSITGCGYKKAKSNQYFALAEAIDEFKPDIVTIDANEPDVDHWDLNQIKFYDQNGGGAKTFFLAMGSAGMTDTYYVHYDRCQFELGKPLTASVYVNNKGYCRYDFIYARTNRFTVEKSEYLYQMAIEASSDHAVVVAELEMIAERGAEENPNNQLVDNCLHPYNKLQERHLIKFCRYYGHDVPGSSSLMAEYERHWIEDVLQGERDITFYVNGYDLNWLQTFNVEDGVPLGLKALLFNRYFHWSSYSTVDHFKEWYLTVYLTGKYGER